MAGTNHNSNGRPASKRRTWLSLGAIAVALAVIPVFTRPGPLRVRTTTVGRGPIRSLISTNGKAEPIQNFEDIANSEDEFYKSRDKILLEDTADQKRQRGWEEEGNFP